MYLLFSKKLKVLFEKSKQIAVAICFVANVKMNSEEDNKTPTSRFQRVKHFTCNTN
jgi:hypothetical protein